jgi:hypothetical protein
MGSGGDFGGHPSYSKFSECIELAFAVMNEGLQYYKLKGDGKDMERCHPDCPHEDAKLKGYS